MHLPFFLQKFGRDMVYLSVICGLIGWIWVDGEREKAWNILAFEGIDTFSEFRNRYNLKLQKELDGIYYDYPTDYNRTYWNRIIRANSEIQNLKKSLHEALNESKNSIQNNRGISNLSNLKLVTQKLCDSLIQYVDNEPKSAIKIKSLLAQNFTSTYWEPAENLPNYKRKIFLKMVEIKADAAFDEVLNYLGSRFQSESNFFDRMYPVSIPDNPIIMKGEIYKAQIFLAHVPSTTSNLIVKVNDKFIPIVDGSAHFSKRYLTPGEKNYTVIIEEKNPFTGKTVSTYSRMYQLMVIDSCR